MYSNVERAYQNPRRAKIVLRKIKKMLSKNTNIEKTKNAMLDANWYFLFPINAIDMYIANNVTIADYNKTIRYTNNPSDFHVFINSINRRGYEKLYLKIMEVRNKKGRLSNVRVVSFHPTDNEIKEEDRRPQDLQR